jgi:molybdopterin-guanine dinucleotide biosynthesis protein A
LNRFAGFPKIVGLILAGGNSSRMTLHGTHQHKALMPLAGKRFIDHIEDRLLPQVDRLLVSTNLPNFESCWPIVRDDADASSATIGPLAGIIAGLNWLAQFNQQQSMEERLEWMQICPVDAPLLPTDLCAQLWLGREQSGTRLLLPIDDQRRAQPLFSMVHIALLPKLLDFNAQGQRSFLKFAIDLSSTQQVPIKEGGQGRLLNINTEQELNALSQ